MLHPAHPALVHFPVACWTLAVIADFTGIWLGRQAWQWSGGLLVVGCTMALAAMVAGLMELTRVPEGDALRDTYIHMGVMLAAFSLFVFRLLAGMDRMRFQASNPLSRSEERHVGKEFVTPGIYRGSTRT